METVWLTGAGNGARTPSYRTGRLGDGRTPRVCKYRGVGLPTFHVFVFDSFESERLSTKIYFICSIVSNRNGFGIFEKVFIHGIIHGRIRISLLTDVDDVQICPVQSTLMNKTTGGGRGCDIPLLPLITVRNIKPNLT